LLRPLRLLRLLPPVLSDDRGCDPPPPPLPLPTHPSHPPYGAHASSQRSAQNSIRGRGIFARAQRRDGSLEELLRSIGIGEEWHATILTGIDAQMAYVTRAIALTVFIASRWR